MVIVLIHWRINPTDKDQADFFKFWTEQAKVKDKSGLAGEFLSAPMPAKDLMFRVDTLCGDSTVACCHFVNFGFWESSPTFHDQIGQYMNHDKPPMPFEAERRT